MDAQADSTAFSPEASEVYPAPGGVLLRSSRNKSWYLFIPSINHHISHAATKDKQKGRDETSDKKLLRR